MDRGQGHRRRAAILKYVRETAAENGIDRHIRYRPPGEARRLVDAGRALDGRGRGRQARARPRRRFTCNFLFMCCGYYDYEGGYTPEFPGATDFEGRIVHPQKWPEDLDYAGKRVVVIGSGATAVTLVPAMAKTAGARHHAAALADLCGVAPGGGSARQQAARASCRPSSPTT